MYDELVKRLRELQILTEHCDEQLCLECKNRKLCDKYDNKTVNRTYKEAANAIEELCGLCASQSKDCSEAVAKYIELWEKQPCWIPVTERLPSWGEDVLISISGFCNVGNLVQTNDEKQYNWYYSGWYHDPQEVTHWMPLPEPPKEE